VNELGSVNELVWSVMTVGIAFDDVFIFGGLNIGSEPLVFRDVRKGIFTYRGDVFLLGGGENDLEGFGTVDRLFRLEASIWIAGKNALCFEGLNHVVEV